MSSYHRWACLSLMLVGLAAAAALGQGRAPVPRTVMTASYRLGLGVFQQPAGVQIAWVEAGGPCTRLARVDNPGIRGILETGDIITHLDGRPIATVSDIIDGLARSAANGGRLRLRVRDV